MKRILIVYTLSIILLAGCAGLPPQNAQQSVFGIKQDYAVALTLAVAYTKLPPCATGGPPVCKDPKIVNQLRKIDDASIALLDGAEVVVRTGGGNAAMAIAAAQQAVAAFASVTQTLRFQ